MKFSLNPSSGYTDSFFDIKFKLEFPKSTITEVKILNSKTNSYLDILSVDNGVIRNNDTIVCKNCNEISGFINIFNKDKNNKNLASYPYIQLIAEINSSGEIFKAKTTFYNESMSVDASIIPMEVTINNDLDFSSQEDLSIFIKSEKYKHFEFVIREEKTDKNFNFEVITYDKKSLFKIPKEIIYHEFGLDKLTINTLNLYWVKFEGVNFMKFLNKKLIKIPKCTINIRNNNLKLHKQNRLGPLGNLDQNFVISDRYFNHTFKNFSHFGARSEDSIKMKRLSLFFNESITMNKVDSEFSNFPTETKKEITESNIALKNNKVKNFGFMKHKEFLNIYSNNSSQQTSTSEKPVQTCKPCSRKK